MADGNESPVTVPPDTEVEDSSDGERNPIIFAIAIGGAFVIIVILTACILGVVHSSRKRKKRTRERNLARRKREEREGRFSDEEEFNKYSRALSGGYTDDVRLDIDEGFEPANEEVEVAVFTPLPITPPSRDSMSSGEIEEEFRSAIGKRTSSGRSTRSGRNQKTGATIRRSSSARSAGARSSGARSSTARSSGSRPNTSHILEIPPVAEGEEYVLVRRSSSSVRSTGARSSGARSSGPRSSGPRSPGLQSSGPRSPGPRSPEPRSSERRSWDVRSGRSSGGRSGTSQRAGEEPTPIRRSSSAKSSLPRSSSARSRSSIPRTSSGRSSIPQSHGAVLLVPRTDSGIVKRSSSGRSSLGRSSSGRASMDRSTAPVKSSTGSPRSRSTSRSGGTGKGSRFGAFAGTRGSPQGSLDPAEFQSEPDAPMVAYVVQSQSPRVSPKSVAPPTPQPVETNNSMEVLDIVDYEEDVIEEESSTARESDLKDVPRSMSGSSARSGDGSTRITEGVLRRKNSKHRSALGLAPFAAGEHLGEEGIECGICMVGISSIDSQVQLRCDHVFHSRCIADWFINEDVCPSCR